ncbi:hypothetical protein B0T22DRAFT_446651 [Podospora appendiculata]|uniref:Uncharacterized protein n=1 Tax=Podospora appendiculata TaxID=314037 RepID=A0AAE0XF91_9PEZI|nr:hypothetical protein B0T22DRAFT_446651 [Podospora appendiculata]
MKRIVIPTNSEDGNESKRTQSQSQSQPQPPQSTPAATAPTTTPTSASSSQEPWQFLPPEILDIAVPSLKVGAGVGALGLFAGAAFGIARSPTPVLYSLASGGQWFALGSSYYASRQVVFNVMGKDEELRSGQKVHASAAAGGFAGMIGGLLRGPRNILPGAVMFSLFGAGGQVVANALRPGENDATPWGRILDHKFSPMTRLSDREYENMLEEKLLRVEAEIALVDDHINELRAVGQRAEQQGSPEAINSTAPPES